MNPLTLSILLGIIDGGFKLLSNHLGKPDGWIPSQEEWDALNQIVRQSTPEVVKAEARERLGIPPASEVPTLDPS